jgi:hypothetical protein
MAKPTAGPWSFELLIAEPWVCAVASVVRRHSSSVAADQSAIDTQVIKPVSLRTSKVDNAVMMCDNGTAARRAIQPTLGWPPGDCS